MLAAACGAAEALFGQEDSPTAEIGSPVGVWSCVLYERLAPDNDYVLIRFDPGGTTHIARQRADGFRVWAPASAWTARKKRLSFSDSRMGREFDADLRRSGLGGTWKAETANGGWWCARLDAAVKDWQDVESLTAADVMPPLIPHGMSTPYYPLRALRQAKEGRAAVCFLVESTGTIVQPELIEVSDDIFRQTVLRAVMASNYRGWAGEPAVRPGCRTFDFALDPIE